MWNNVVYHKGSLKVVAYDENGNPAMEKVVKTAGKPAALKLSCDRASLAPDGEDLAYVTVSVVDKDGNEVPYADNEVSVKVTGAGHFKAIANGDPTCLESFQTPRMHLFSGKLTVIVQSDNVQPSDSHSNNAQTGEVQSDNVRSDKWRSDNVLSDKAQYGKTQLDEVQLGKIQSGKIQPNGVQCEKVKYTNARRTPILLEVSSKGLKPAILEF